eukprot:403552-Pyramimonas_sp.AAC.1
MQAGNEVPRTERGVLVFYLRHILLNYPKPSFADCKTHAGRRYPTYEQALVATGYFATADEPAR